MEGGGGGEIPPPPPVLPALNVVINSSQRECKTSSQERSQKHLSKMMDCSEKYNADFEDVGKIASGKFGTVYRARNVITDDIFAAKHVK